MAQDAKKTTVRNVRSEFIAEGAASSVNEEKEEKVDAIEKNSDNVDEVKDTQLSTKQVKRKKISRKMKLSFAHRV